MLLWHNTLMVLHYFHIYNNKIKNVRMCHRNIRNMTTMCLQLCCTFAYFYYSPLNVYYVCHVLFVYNNNKKNDKKAINLWKLFLHFRYYYITVICMYIFAICSYIYIFEYIHSRKKKIHTWMHIMVICWGWSCCLVIIIFFFTWVII